MLIFAVLTVTAKANSQAIVVSVKQPFITF